MSLFSLNKSRNGRQFEDRKRETNIKNREELGTEMFRLLFAVVTLPCRIVILLHKFSHEDILLARKFKYSLNSHKSQVVLVLKTRAERNSVA